MYLGQGSDCKLQILRRLYCLIGGTPQPSCGCHTGDSLGVVMPLCADNELDPPSLGCHVWFTPCCTRPVHGQVVWLSELLNVGPRQPPDSVQQAIQESTLRVLSFPIKTWCNYGPMGFVLLILFLISPSKCSWVTLTSLQVKHSMHDISADMRSFPKAGFSQHLAPWSHKNYSIILMTWSPQAKWNWGFIT